MFNIVILILMWCVILRVWYMIIVPDSLDHKISSIIDEAHNWIIRKLRSKN